MKRVFFATALICAMLTGCGSDDTSAKNRETEEALKLSEKSIYKTVGNCQSDTSSCLSVEIKVPLGEGDSEAAKGINEFFQGGLASSLTDFSEDKTVVPDLDAAVDELLANFDRFSSEYPENTEDWYFDGTGKVLWKSDSLISLELTTSSYMGGAHPNTYTRLATCKLADGTRLSLEALATGMKKAQLALQAEAAFRKRFNMADTATFAYQGFFFESGQFELPENYALTERGLLLLYNTYEAASYAEGPIELVIPVK